MCYPKRPPSVAPLDDIQYCYLLSLSSFFWIFSVCKGTIKWGKCKRKTCFSFHFRAIVPSTGRSEVRLSENKTKGKSTFFIFLSSRSTFDRRKMHWIRNKIFVRLSEPYIILWFWKTDENRPQDSENNTKRHIKSLTWWNQSLHPITMTFSFRQFHKHIWAEWQPHSAHMSSPFRPN